MRCLRSVPVTAVVIGVRSRLARCLRPWRVRDARGGVGDHGCRQLSPGHSCPQGVRPWLASAGRAAGEDRLHAVLDRHGAVLACIREIERRYPDPTVLEGEISRWWEV